MTAPYTLIARELRLWLGVLALLGQLLSPLAHLHARAGAPFDGAASLCAPGGSPLADLRGDGAPQAPDGPAAVCPPCTLAGGPALPPPEPAFVAPVPVAGPVSFVEPAGRSAQAGGAAAYGSRAPPAFL
jgi:hypothetical protein